MHRLSLPILVLLAFSTAVTADDRVIAPPGTSLGLPFSPGVLSDDFLYLSGAIGNEPGTTVVKGDTAAQVKKTMENLETVLKAADLDFSRVVASHVYLADARYFDTMNEVYGEYFADDKPPTRTTIEADIAIVNSEMEIGMIAARKGVELEWIVPEGWAKSPFYGWGVRAGNTVFVSGMVSFDPTTRQLITGDFAKQAKQTLKNIDTILKTAGLGPENVVTCGVYLPDARDYGTMNEIYGGYFSKNPPARATVRARLANPALKIEITCVAVDGEKEIILPAGAKPSTRPLSHATKVGGTLYLSGMVGRRSDGTYPAGVEAQTQVVFERLRGSLAAAGMSVDDVVSATVFLTDVRHYQAMNKIYAENMPEVPPARATVGTVLMSPDALVEIQMTAVKTVP